LSALEGREREEGGTFPHKRIRAKKKPKAKGNRERNRERKSKEEAGYHLEGNEAFSING